MRTSLLVALAVGLFVAVPASAAEQGRIASHCSASGDVCYGIFKGPSLRFTLPASV